MKSNFWTKLDRVVKKKRSKILGKQKMVQENKIKYGHNGKRDESRRKNLLRKTENELNKSKTNWKTCRGQK